MMGARQPDDALATQARAAANQMLFADLRALIENITNVASHGVNKMALVDRAVQAALEGDWVPN